MAVGGVIVLRRRPPESCKFQTPGHPWIPVGFVAASLWVVIYTAIAQPWGGSSWCRDCWHWDSHVLDFLTPPSEFRANVAIQVIAIAWRCVVDSSLQMVAGCRQTKRTKNRSACERKPLAIGRGHLRT